MAVRRVPRWKSQYQTRLCHVRKTSNRIGRAFYRASGCHLVFHGPAGVDRLSVAPACPKTAQEGTMTVTSSRRDVLHFGCGTAAVLAQEQVHPRSLSE